MLISFNLSFDDWRLTSNWSDLKYPVLGNLLLLIIIHLAVCNFWRDKKSYLLAALYKKLVTLQSDQLFTELTVTNFLQSAQSALS